MEGHSTATRSARSFLQDVNQPSSQPGAQTDAARVLVTGANGQIGRRLIERLARSNPRVAVRAVVRSERAAETLQGFPVELFVEAAPAVDVWQSFGIDVEGVGGARVYF